MSNPSQNQNENPLFSWIITLIMLGVFWPIGLILLIRMLTRGSLSSQKRAGHPYAASRPAAAPAAPQPAPARPAAQVNPKWGRPMVIGGVLCTAVGGLMLAGRVVDWISYYLPYGYDLYGYEIRGALYLAGLTAVGVVLLLCGVSRQKKAARYRRYLSLIGQQESLSIAALAEAMPVSPAQARADLQDMLERGFLPAGYIDAAEGRIVFSRLREKPKPAEPPKKAAQPEGDVLDQIRAVNDAIADEAMSRKIDRVGVITAKILDYQRQHPESSSELRSFLNYYLPTTLKILRAYAQLEAQGIEGQNISATKARIEGMMDKVVEGFERRLDQLFRSEAVDITSDVQVLEQMLQKDGLSGDGLKLDV